MRALCAHRPAQRIRESLIAVRLNGMNEVISTAEWTGSEPHPGPESYHIEATKSLVDRTLRTLKHDDLFGVFDKQGDFRGGDGSPDGLYFQDTRFLSHLELRLGGLEPLLLGSVVIDDNGALIVDLANADLHDAEGRIWLQRDSLYLGRLKFLRGGTCYERFRLRRFGPLPAPIPLEIAFGADFADLFEVRGERRPRRGTMRAAKLDDRTRPLRLFRPRRNRALHDPPFRSAARLADPALRALEPGVRRQRKPPCRDADHLLDRRRRRRAGRPGAGLSRGAPAQSAARRRTRRDRQLERPVQRGDRPVGIGPVDAADRHPDRPLSLCRRALVQHHLRPRRHHHRDRAAVGRAGNRPRRAEDAGRRSRPTRSTRPPTPSPARSFTKCAAARWRGWARSRSAAITARSTRPRSSSCSPASISSAPATSRRFARSGPTSVRGARLDRHLWRSPTATASSNISG